LVLASFALAVLASFPPRKLLPADDCQKHSRNPENSQKHYSLTTPEN
jgi:hypothetical protein